MTLSPILGVLAILAIGVAGWSAPENLKWWQTGIIYQVYPRSFKDSDGDGVGDLRGITSKLLYLKELGVAAVWISPVYPSPMVDFGYDITDFTAIDETYGTMEDFDDFVEEAHKLGLKVIMDIIPNHTSDQHPWFIASEDPAHPEHEKYKDYYKWHPGRIGPDGKRSFPTNWLSIFRGPAWTFNEKRQMYFFHHFHKKQPDINLRIPAVKEEIKKVFRFWMDRKVDGFRVDAAPFLFQDPELKDAPPSGIIDDPDNPNYLYQRGITQHLDEIYDVVREWQEVIDERDDADRVLMTEGYASIEDIMKYYGTKERPVSSFPFNFFLLMDLGRNSKATDFARVINNWMDHMIDGRWPNWVLGNHDRNRVASRVRAELVDALNMLILSLPGTAITYYGEEIGMEDTFVPWEKVRDPQAILSGLEGYINCNRDQCRTPMQWDDTTSAGFSTNSSPWLPLHPNYRKVNVKNQCSIRSHYSIFRQMVEVRKNPTMQRGDVKVKEVGGLLFIERILKKGAYFVLVINLDKTEATLSHSHLGKMEVFASSLNSGLKDRQTLGKTLRIKPYAAVLLQSEAISRSSSNRSRESSSLLKETRLPSDVIAKSKINGSRESTSSLKKTEFSVLRNGKHYKPVR